MKKNKGFILLALSVVSIFSLSSYILINQSDTHENTNTSDAIVVVELFTSQGCSSCPRADQTLIELQNHAEKDNIFLLSYHVSYWNYLGWKDPYSQDAFSAKQRIYDRALNSNTYTPQMVFNGRTECVGSNKAKVTSLIQNELRRGKEYSLKVKQQEKISQNKLKVSVELDRPDEGMSLNVALVQKSATTSIKRGENYGRTLNHCNVVRSVKSESKLSGSNSFELDVPENLGPDEFKVIAYLQDNRSYEIFSAASLNSVN